MARSLQPGSIPEGLGLRRAGLVIQDLNGIHVFILAPDVLVHQQWRQAGPHTGSHEGAQLDHIALVNAQANTGDFSLSYIVPALLSKIQGDNMRYSNFRIYSQF